MNIQCDLCSLLETRSSTRELILLRAILSLATLRQLRYIALIV